MKKSAPKAQIKDPSEKKFSLASAMRMEPALFKNIGKIIKAIFENDQPKERQVNDFRRILESAQFHVSPKFNPYALVHGVMGEDMLFWELLVILCENAEVASGLDLQYIFKELLAFEGDTLPEATLRDLMTSAGRKSYPAYKEVLGAAEEAIITAQKKETEAEQFKKETKGIISALEKDNTTQKLNEKIQQLTKNEITLKKILKDFKEKITILDHQVKNKTIELEAEQKEHQDKEQEVRRLVIGLISNEAHLKYLVEQQKINNLVLENKIKIMGQEKDKLLGEIRTQSDSLSLNQDAKRELLDAISSLETKIFDLQERFEALQTENIELKRARPLNKYSDEHESSVIESAKVVAAENAALRDENQRVQAEKMTLERRLHETRCNFNVQNNQLKHFFIGIQNAQHAAQSNAMHAAYYQEQCIGMTQHVEQLKQTLEKYSKVHEQSFFSVLQDHNEAIHKQYSKLIGEKNTEILRLEVTIKRLTESATRSLEQSTSTNNTAIPSTETTEEMREKLRNPVHVEETGALATSLEDMTKELKRLLKIGETATVARLFSPSEAAACNVPVDTHGEPIPSDKKMELEASAQTLFGIFNPKTTKTASQSSEHQVLDAAVGGPSIY